jgi:nitrite reductase/ring-hydroxylating ferredoxin subunit
MSDPLLFIPTIPADQVKPNRIKFIEVENQRLILTRIAGELCAFNALCPHQLGDLSRGIIYNGEIECPVHAWRFNIRTGHSVYPEEETLHLRRYEVKEDSGIVMVKPPPSTFG